MSVYACGCLLNVGMTNSAVKGDRKSESQGLDCEHSDMKSKAQDMDCEQPVRSIFNKSLYTM